jgi:hypothetical protein
VYLTTEKRETRFKTLRRSNDFPHRKKSSYKQIINIFFTAYFCLNTQSKSLEKAFIMSNNNSANRNQKIFRIIFLIFLGVVLYFLYDLSRQTTAPWKKKKNIERSF